MLTAVLPLIATYWNNARFLYGLDCHLVCIKSLHILCLSSSYVHCKKRDILDTIKRNIRHLTVVGFVTERMMKASSEFFLGARWSAISKKTYFLPCSSLLRQALD